MGKRVKGWQTAEERRQRKEAWRKEHATRVPRPPEPKFKVAPEDWEYMIEIDAKG